MLSDPVGRLSRAIPMILSDSASTGASPRQSTSAILILPCTKAVATRNGWANCASTTWVGRRFGRPAAELVGVAGRIGLDRHRLYVTGPSDSERRPSRQLRVDRRVQRPAARIGLVTQRLPANARAKVAQQQRGIVPVRLIQLQEPETTIEDVVRPGEPSLRQDSGEHTRARCLAGLHTLGQRAVQDALAVASSVTIGDA